jgi:hypothetical protein
MKLDDEPGQTGHQHRFFLYVLQARAAGSKPVVSGLSETNSFPLLRLVWTTALILQNSLLHPRVSAIGVLVLVEM